MTGARRLWRGIAAWPARVRRLTQSGAYQPEIDGLRFIAIALVVLAHLLQRAVRMVEFSQPLSAFDRGLQYLMPAPATGVMLFFAISGYILAVGHARLVDSGKPFGLGRYFQRRASRLVPPYLVVLTGTYLALSLSPFQPELVSSAQIPASLFTSFAASALYVHGVLFGAFSRVFPPGWSLEVEIQFYLVAPAVFILYFRQRDVAKRCVLGGAVMAASMVLLWLGERRFGETTTFYFTLGRYFQYFWIGIWIADLARLPLWRRGLTARQWDGLAFLGLASLAAVGIAAYFSDDADLNTLLHGLRIAAIALLFAGAMFGRGFRGFCSAPWISLLGGACYSYYLVHLQIMQAVAPLLAHAFRPRSLAVAFALEFAFALPPVLLGGLLFYVFIERPFMDPAWPSRLRSAWSRRFRPA